MNNDHLKIGSPEATQYSLLHPARPLNHKYVAPVLYLAERLVTSDKGTIMARRVMSELAEKAKETNFREQPWYRELSDDRACQRLDVNMTKHAAIVVLSLLLRVGKKKPEESEYFMSVHARLGNPEVLVPVDVHAHAKLAEDYIAS